MSHDQVEFLQTKKEHDHFWHVLDSEQNIVNNSSEVFSNLGNAKNNLLILHTLIGVDLVSLASGIKCKHVTFYDDNQDKQRWRVVAQNGEIVGAAHKGFDSDGEAKNNLLMTYSLVSTYLAKKAAEAGVPK